MRKISAWALLVLLAFPGAAWAVGYVQGGTNAVFSGTTIGVTLTGVVANHNLRATVCWDAATLTLSGVSDGTHSFTLIGSPTGSGNTYNCQQAYYPTSGSGSVTVTATLSGACTGCAMVVDEYSGDATTSPLDGSNGQNIGGTGTPGQTLQTGSFTTTVNGDSVYAVLYSPQGVAPTAGAGFTLRTSGNGMFSEDEVQGSAGAVNPSFSSGSGAFDYYALGAGFKPTGGASPKPVALFFGVPIP